MESVIVPVSGLITFETLSEMRLYVKQLLSYYERQYDVYSQRVAVLMRAFEKQERGRDLRRLATDNWAKVSMLMVNTKDPLLGMLEVMLESMEEYKLKTARTEEVLMGFDDLESYASSNDSPVTLYLRNGVPMKIVFEDIAKAISIESARKNQP